MSDSDQDRRGDTAKNVKKSDTAAKHAGAQGDPEPTACDGNDPSYAFDGEQKSPMSAGLKRLVAAEKAGLFSMTDRLANFVAVALLFAIAITAVISIAAGACCLASLSGKEFNRFPLFFGLGGVVPVVIGCICLVLVVSVMVFISTCAMGLRRYGMCCYGASRSRSCARVCLLGVFPFLVFIVLLALCILGFTFYSLSQQLPPLDKDYIKVDGLSGPVEIVRDENGLTHIKASSRRDAYVGQGFAEAQDRLFQLEFHRTVAKGELSTMVGEDGRSTDVSIRTINVRDAAYAMCNNTTPELRDLLQAFADGVNLFLQRESKRPVEFFFMSTKPLYFHDPKPFSAADVCLTARLFQWQMSSNIDVEGQRFSVWAGTGRTYAEVESLYNDYTQEEYPIMSTARMVEMLVKNGAIASDDPTVVQEALQRNMIAERTSSVTEGLVYDNILSLIRPSTPGAGGNVAEAATTRSAHAVVSRALGQVMSETFYMEQPKSVFPYRFLYASNAWAARDAQNRTMVASDPHLTLNLPSIWYYNHLSFPDENGVQYDAAGVSMVGVSGVHIGKTTYIAWGITLSMTDLEDLFIFPPAMFAGLPERMYRYGGVNRVFTARRERVQIKGKRDVVLDLDDTLFGPIVSTMLGFPPTLTVALWATPLRHDDTTSVKSLLAWSDPKTDTAEKMMNALLELPAPGFSIPVGDVHGNIAWAVTGRHPLRPSGHTGKYPGVIFDAVGLLNLLAQFSGGQPAGTPPNLTLLTPVIRSFMQTSNWTTYVSGDAAVRDQYIPSEFNPHIHIPADGTEAHISCANQKVVPNGFPYYLGGDYSWSYRGRRIQEVLDASTGNLHDVNVHLGLQLDYRSNMWAYTFQPIVNGTAFRDAIADDPRAAQWLDRLLAWDGLATIGSTETSFLWRWIARLAQVPRDAIQAAGARVWRVDNNYMARMLVTPTERMLADCAAYLGAPASNTSCWEFAVAEFKAQAREGEKRWGQDLNRIRGIHEMVDTKPIYPLFRREGDKAGDRTCVGVSDHVVTGNMISTQAASVRQVYDLWNRTDIIHVAFPGGNNGNPYSKYYQNMWDLYTQDKFVEVKVTWPAVERGTASHRQTLSR